MNNATFRLKVRPSPSKKYRAICFVESPLKMMKNAFYLTLKALFVLNDGHVGKNGLIRKTR